MSTMTKGCSNCGARVPDADNACPSCGHRGFRLDGSVECATFTVTAEHYNGLGGLHMEAMTITEHDDDGNAIGECTYSFEIAGRALYLNRKGCYPQRINLDDLIRVWAAVEPLRRDEVTS